jgi:hypothetical protein
VIFPAPGVERAHPEEHLRHRSPATDENGVKPRLVYRDGAEPGLDVVAGELVGVYSKPYKDDIVLFFRANVVGRNPWQPNDEISHMGYFGRSELPEPMGLGVRTRIIDALAGSAGIMRIIPVTPA